MSEPIRTPGVLDPEPAPLEDLDVTLRPRRLDEFVGQEADQLLDGAAGETPEDLIAHALKGTRR